MSNEVELDDIDVNVFAAVDVKGFLKKFGKKIERHYGSLNLAREEFHTEHDSAEIAMLERIRGGQQSICTIGYVKNTDAVQKYTRLVTDRAHTVGHEIKRGDVREETIGGHKREFLRSSYNLRVVARKGDTIAWWSHGIDPRTPNRVVISSIKVHGSGKLLREVRPLTQVFPTTGRPLEDKKLHGGFREELAHAYAILRKVNASTKTSITYDIELLILSASYRASRVGRIVVPFVKIKVDPSIYVSDRSLEG